MIKEKRVMPAIAVLLGMCIYAVSDSVIPAKAGGKHVSQTDMQKIYEEVKTPYKHGVILKPEPGKMLDNPNVFRWQDKWYMLYIMFDSRGYETYLASSDDLLSWKSLGKVLPYGEEGSWDQWQADGGPSLFTTEWGGANTVQEYGCRYWMTYIGGAKQGYETDPLSIGVAWTKDPGQPSVWTRFKGNPVLSNQQDDVRDFERTTLYKSFVVWDKKESTGYPFVMYYNAKGAGGERIGMAVSRDMLQWTRYGQEPVIENGTAGNFGISGDPMITKIGNVWVMFYFGAFWQPQAFETFACSYDLVTWTKWTGDHLVKPSEPWDQQYAHKPWVIRHDGVVYHFYCAVGDQGRVIGLATSKDLKVASSSVK